MKLLFVNDTPYLPQAHGGVEWNTHELSGALMRHGIEVALLAPIKPTDMLGLMNRVKRRSGFWDPWPRDDAQGYPVFRGWNIQDGVEKIARHWGADKIVVQGSSPQFGLAAKNGGIPTYYYFHHEMSRLPPQGEWRDLSGFLACSPFLAALSRDAYGIDITVVRPLVAPGRCKTLVTPRVALSFGLQLIKGADTVLNMAEARPDIPFRIVETWTLDKWETQALRERAKALSNVEVMPPSNDVRQFLKDAKVLLVPSRWNEAWGRVVTEAHVNSIPVLASDAGGLPDAVGEGGICVCKTAAQSEWNRQLSHLWDDDGYYQSITIATAKAAQRPEIQEHEVVRAFLAALKCN